MGAARLRTSAFLQGSWLLRAKFKTLRSYLVVENIDAGEFFLLLFLLFLSFVFSLAALSVMP